MKRIVSVILILSMTLALAPMSNGAFGASEPVSAGAALTPFQAELESKYTDPDRVFGTEVRWWLGEASHTVETLMDEIQALYDGGFRGAELCMQSDGNNANNPIYAYGSQEWSYKWKLMMNKLLDLGMTVSLTSGTNWSTANLPYNPNTGEGLDPDSQAASQIISMGTSTVNAGAALTELPQPGTRRSVARFLGAYAYREISNNYVDPNTAAVNLTPMVTQGATVWNQTLSWTPPEGTGTWRIFAYWSQGAAQTASPAQYTCYAINYFDLRGFNALKDFWEAHYLDDPDLNAKILAGDVQLFMDSIELNSTGGITYWTEDLPEEFLKRKGYDIMPYMFLVGDPGSSQVMQSLNSYRLDGEEVLNRKIQNDFLEVLTDLQMERKFGPLKTWLNSVGIKTRYQPSYGRSFEVSEPILYIDYVETETLNGYNQIDSYRLHAGGAKLQNKVFSCETSAVPRFSFSNQYHFRDAYSFYAAGGQRIIWHVYGADYNLPTATASNWLSNDGAMGTFFRFGQRNPVARDYDEFNAHLGRAQQLMQTGKARSDVGFIHNNWRPSLSYGAGITFGSNSQLTHVGRTYRSTELQNNGYTYEYFSPEFLFADDVYFDEETKTIESAGYKALVLYQSYLDVKGAQRILDWAKKGLRVVILDDAATYSMFTTNTDAELAAIMAELKALPTVRTATTADYVPLITIGTTASPATGGYDNNVLDMLQELGVYPYADFAETNYQLLTQTRIDDDGNLYLYAYNYCPNDCHHNSRDTRIQGLDHGTSAKTEITMDGMFIPYEIDAWSGKVTRMANYRYENGRTVFPIDLDYDNIALFAFEAIDSESLHIVSTNAESSYVTQNGLVARATESGAYTADLNNGATYQGAVTVPAPYNITGWDLTVGSWNAGANALSRSEPRLDGDGTTTDQKWATAITNINAQFDTMTTWNNIPEVGREHSGYGRYEASFNWDAGAASGAYLDLGGTFVGSMKVWINGQKVGGDISTNPTKAKRSVGVTVDGAVPTGKDEYTGGVSWMKPIVDVGAYLADGSNTIVIEYSSDLTNRMRQRGTVTATQISTIGGAWWDYFSDYRAYGPAQAVIVPYVEQVIPFSTVFAYIRSDEPAVAVNAPASYTVSLENATGAGVVTLSFIADSRYLDLNDATALNGFTILDPLAWEYIGSQLWKGTVKLYCPAFVQSDDPLDVLRVSGTARSLLGDTTVTLADISVTGDVDGFSGARLALIITAEAATSIVPSYSKYDLNHDGRIDELDLAIVVFYYLANDLESDWDVVKFDIASAKDCDVAVNGRVDLADMIEVIANYADSY
ncbi:MAG: hypothetical protein FWH55_10210 [Oscillospiraceae bacterium]|nr:hypothetical protein [Oscillospiraceae bacterium]